MLSATAIASSAVAIGLGLPGMIGMPREYARSRARVLSPNSASVSARGPMKAMLSSRHRLAKAAFSDRTP